MKARALLSMPGLTAIGLSVSRNRLVVGITPGSNPAEARQRLDDLGIPDAAVEIEERKAAPLLNGLINRLRPVMGGIDISLQAGDTACTAGFNVMWDSMRVFLTAAHCLPPIASNQDVDVYQNFYGSTNHIGTEVADPTPVACSDTLPFHSICLNSDAALVLYDDSVEWSFGHIARTTFFGQYTGSTTINPAQSRFWITESLRYVLEGDTVNKIGWRTGWTQGVVQAVDQFVREDTVSPPIWIDGSAVVDAGAWHGDSGSPVFEVSTYGKATLVGVLWGGYAGGPFYFSPLGQVQKDFGNYLDVITDAPALPSGLSITGPTRIRPGATCLWTGNVTGGTTPYTYSWTNDGFTVSDSISYRGGKLAGETGSTFVLEFTVINDAGSNSTQITVQEDSTASICRN